MFSVKQEIADFASRLRAERERLGLSQSQLAKAGGVKRVSQHLYERGDRTPTIEYAIRITTVGVRLDHVLGFPRELQRQNPTIPIHPNNLTSALRTIALLISQLPSSPMPLEQEEVLLDTIELLKSRQVIGGADE